jgi:hypothetical protein
MYETACAVCLYICIYGTLAYKCAYSKIHNMRYTHVANTAYKRNKSYQDIFLPLDAVLVDLASYICEPFGACVLI